MSKPSTTNDAMADGRLYHARVLYIDDGQPYASHPRGASEHEGCYPSAESVDEVLAFFAETFPAMQGRQAIVTREFRRDFHEPVGTFEVPRVRREKVGRKRSLVATFPDRSVRIAL